MSASPPHVLLVEGQDDKHVVRHLLIRHGFASAPEIVDKGGFGPLRDSIDSELKVPGRRTVGVLADADDDIESRWQSLADAFRDADCHSVPDHPTPDCVFNDPRGVRAGIWLMPDNQNPGELEDFVAGLVPAKDPVWPRAMSYIDGIPAQDRKFSKVKRAHIHAWLAAREEPRQMGLAIGIGDLDPNAQAAAPLLSWMRALFSTSRPQETHV